MKYFFHSSKKIGDVCIKKNDNEFTICSQRIEARSLNQYEENLLIAQYSSLLENPENTSMFGEGKPWSLLEVKEFIQNEIKRWNSGNGFSVFSLYNSTTNEYMGYLQVKHSLDEFKDIGHGHSNVAEIIYILDKKFWGRGYGTEIAILGKKFIKQVIADSNKDSVESNIKEIVATVYPQNEGSKRILQKTLKQQEPEEFIKFGGKPRILFFKSLESPSITAKEIAITPISVTAKL